jgi:hypothetical protein
MHDDDEFFERYGMACEGVMITSGMMFLIMFAKRAGIPDEALRATFEQQLAAAGAIEGAVRGDMTPEEAGEDAIRRARKSMMTIVKDEPKD